MLGKGDQLFHVRADFARLGQRRLDLFVLDKAGGHVPEHCQTMAGSPAELAMGITVTHF
jgi:hypothetical protein